MKTRIRPRTASMALGLVLVAVLGALLFDRSTHETRPKDVEAKHTIVTVDDTLASGAQFTVRYAPRREADADRLRPSLAVGLEKNRRRLYVLTAEHSSRPPRARPAGESFPLPDVELIGPGTFTFTLPELDDGFYQLCGAVGFEASGTGQRINDNFCRTVSVE